MVVFLRPFDATSSSKLVGDRSQCSTSGSTSGSHLGSHSKFSMRDSRFAWRYSTWRHKVLILGAVGAVGDLALALLEILGEKLWKIYMENLYGKPIWKHLYGNTDGKPVGNLWKNRGKTCRKSNEGKPMENRWKKHGRFSPCFSMDSRA